MQSLKCPHCGEQRIVSKAVEFREINMKNMSLTSTRKLIEQECMDCGHIDMVEPECFAIV